MDLTCTARDVPAATIDGRRDLFIPQELVDYVLDHLHQDKQTLRQCSLVCRAWVASSSLHLFECLSWPPCVHTWSYDSSHSDSDSFPCKCSTLDYSSIWQQLLEFVRTHRVRKNLQQLRLWCDSGAGQVETPAYPIPVSELQGILSELPSLRELYVTGLGVQPLSVPPSVPSFSGSDCKGSTCSV